MMVTIKLLNNKLLNIMKKQMFYSMSEKLLVENHEGRCCRNFAKNEFWKV